MSSHFGVVELRDTDNEIHIGLDEKKGIPRGLNKCDSTVHTTQFDITLPGTEPTEELEAF